jgi:gag-polyprotein putative aspartyl protease
MKRSLLVAVALVSISTAASAVELTCAAPRVAVGDDPRDNNPVVKIEVKYSNADHAWRIFHHLRNGLVISRSEQYGIQDASNEHKTQWQGSLNRARHLYMIGEVTRAGTDGIVYLEWLYDRNKNGQLVMHAQARCATTSPPIPQPTASLSPIPQPSSAPSDKWAKVPLREEPFQPKPVKTVPVARAKDSVPIYPHAQGNAAKIDVLIGGQSLRMLLDTGATTCLITDGIAARLVSEGHAIWQENNRFRMADGTVRDMPMVLIRELRIGRHVVRNVLSGVSGTGGIILAFPVLNNIAPFTIDTRVGELIFHTGSGKGDRL